MNLGPELIFHLKNLDILNAEPMLQDIIMAAWEKFGLDVVTSGYRPSDKGTHGTTPLRAIDLRCRDSVIGNHIAKWVNKRWQYDPDRPKMNCAICHDSGSGKGLHLHLQVHPNTIRIKNKWW